MSAPAQGRRGLRGLSFDAGFIDGIVNGIGGAVRRLAGAGRELQTGFVRTYALALFAGAVGILVYVGFRI